jgi:2-polyprenyl-3-methyl-5-hydroxy-6-metoxy-1,4-benzoquinol methylase
MDPKAMYEASWKHQREREANLKAQSGLVGGLRRAFTKDRYEVVLSMLMSAGADKGALVDVGCGRGEVLRTGSAIFDRMVGLDISEVELEKLRSDLPKTVADKTKLVAIDLNSKWPVEDGVFDVVTALSVVEHLFDPYFVSEELARICRPGGHVLIEVPNIAFVKYRLSLLRGVFPLTSGDPVGWDGGHLHYFTLGSICALFERVGCEPVSVRCAGLFHGLRDLWPAMLGSDFAILFRKAR